MKQKDRSSQPVAGFLLLACFFGLAACTLFSGGGQGLLSEDLIVPSYDTREALRYARKEGSLSQAIEQLSSRIQKRPKDIRARLFLSRLYLILGDKIKAEHQAMAVKRYQFNNIQSKLILANISYLKGLSDKTILSLKEILREPGLSKGEQTEALNLMAGIALRQGDDARCLELLQRSLQADPGHLASHMNLALIYIKNHEFSSAITHLKTIQERKPGNFATELNLGICYAGKGEYGRAEAIYEKLYQRKKRHAGLIYNMAVLRFRQKKYKDSIRLLDEFIDKSGSLITAKSKAMALVNDIQMSRVSREGLSDEDVLSISQRLNGKESSPASQSISFDAETELEAGFTFTNMGLMPD